MQENNCLTELKKSYRHERYLYELDTRYKIWYFGSEEELYSYFPKEAPCFIPFDTKLDWELKQRIALRKGLADYQIQNPKGFELIAEFYFGEKISKAELARRHHVARQTISRKLERSLNQLRRLVFGYLAV